MSYGDYSADYMRLMAENSARVRRMEIEEHRRERLREMAVAFVPSLVAITADLGAVARLAIELAIDVESELERQTRPRETPPKNGPYR